MMANVVNLLSGRICISSIDHSTPSSQQVHNLIRRKSKSHRPKQVRRAQTTRSTPIARTKQQGKGVGAGLMIVVPIDTLKMLRMRAAETGSTVRVLVLESLRKCGYSVPLNELVDRRRRLREVRPKKLLSMRKYSSRRTVY